MDRFLRGKAALTLPLLGRRRFLKSALATSAFAITRHVQAAPARRESVLVIGAGLAGLTAAYRLRDAGKRVTLLEARAVPGGRVRTIRNYFDGGLYAEAGPNRISDTHIYMLQWLSEFNLSLVPFSPDNASSILVLNGVRARAGNEAEREKLPNDLHTDEKRLSPAGLLLKYVEGVPDDLGSPDFNADDSRWAEYDRVTWPDWLKSRGASEGAIDLMMLGGDSSTFSALFMLQQIMLHKSQTTYLKIDGGMDRLPLAFAAALKSDIHYNCELTRLSIASNEVRALCRQGGRATTYAADRAVIAIPFSTLREVQIDPPFSPVKTAAIRELPYHEATRYLFQTHTRFWRAEGLSGGARTNGPADIWDTSFGLPGERGVIAMTTGNAEIEKMIAAMPPAARIIYGVDLTKAAFPQLPMELEKTFIQRWAAEPLAKGAFTIFRPGQMTAWATAIARPEGRIHFAGEHTSPWTGWMEGALYSGERAANEILQQ